MSDQLERGSIGHGILIGLGLNFLGVIVLLFTGAAPALPFLGLDGADRKGKGGPDTATALNFPKR
jgi:hypothetical protein